MISVQNHRLQLNGNKPAIGILVLFLLLFSSSCSILFPDREPVTDIPYPDPELEIDTTEIDPDTIPDLVFPEIIKDTYDLAILLPLYLDREYDTLTLQQERISRVAKTYYKGALLALDSMKNCGFKANVHIFDTNNDTTKLNELKPLLDTLDIDLTIGPLFSRSFAHMSKYSAANKINMLSPISMLDKCSQDNPYMLFSNPPPVDYGRKAAEIVTQKFDKKSVFVIRQNSDIEKAIAETFIESVEAESYDTVIDLVFRSISWNADAIPKAYLSEFNLVFVPSNNENFINSVFSQLRRIEANFTVIGMERWVYLGNIEGRMWDRYNVHIITPYYIDYDNPEVIKFVRNYRKTYYAEPNEYAFRGYSDMIYFSEKLMQHGRYFQTAFIEPLNKTMLHNTYEFSESDTCSSWYNRGLQILRFEDYKLKKLR